MVGVELERDREKACSLTLKRLPHHVAASFRLPGPPELRVGRERSDTLAISTAVVLEGSLVHSVCIRVVAAHTKPIGGSPLPEKKENLKEKRTKNNGFEALSIGITTLSSLVSGLERSP